MLNKSLKGYKNMITTYDNVKLRLSKKVLEQMKKDVQEYSYFNYQRALKEYWDTSKMTSNELNKIRTYIFKH
jgi:hypothetical protein